VSLQALSAVLLRGVILRETDVWRAIDAQTQTQGNNNDKQAVVLPLRIRRLRHVAIADGNAVAFCARVFVRVISIHPFVQ
jgi:hypothetical protein